MPQSPAPVTECGEPGWWEPLTWGAETGLAVHREDIPPTTNPALPLSPHSAKETRSQPTDWGKTCAKDV